MRGILRSAFGLPSAAPKAVPSTALVPVPLHRAMPEVLAPTDTLAYLDRGAGHEGAPMMHGAMPMRSADLDVRMAWGIVSGNVRHLVQNSGWVSGAVDQFVAYSIGKGLKPNVEPAHELLKWSPERAKAWAKAVEQYFDDWADDPLCADERGMHTFGELQAAGLRSWFSTGDVISALTYSEGRPGSRYRTAVLGIDPVRVATPPLYQHGGVTIHSDGIEFDDRGRPVAYWLRPTPGSGDPRGQRIAVFGENGRRFVTHSFIGEPGQIRGISPFASVVQALHQTHGLSDAMLVAAHAAASVIGTVTSDLPSKDVGGAMLADGYDPMIASMQQRAEWHGTLAEKGASLTLGASGKIFHLTTGEKFELHAAREHYAHYPEHLKSLLREISRGAGLPYEMLSLDRNAATYSSGRLGLLDFWSLVELRRYALIQPMCKAALEAVVEEGIARQHLDYPGGLRRFRHEKSKALKAKWIGPKAPSVDEMKSVNAAVTRMQNGLSSRNEEVAQLGGDWETTMQQLAHEAETARKLRVPLAPPKGFVEKGGSA